MSGRCCNASWVRAERQTTQNELDARSRARKGGVRRQIGSATCSQDTPRSVGGSKAGAAVLCGPHPALHRLRKTAARLREI